MLQVRSSATLVSWEDLLDTHLANRTDLMDVATALASLIMVVAYASPFRYLLEALNCCLVINNVNHVLAFESLRATTEGYQKA